MFINYSLERIRVEGPEPRVQRSSRAGRTTPSWPIRCCSAAGGHRLVSKIGPSYVFNTVDNPIFPNTGKRYTLSMDVAGLGGNTKYHQPARRGDLVLPAHHRDGPRSASGRRRNTSRKYGDTIALPIFEKLFLGGEYSIRGFDLRTVGPRDPVTGVVIGGNKSLLFNAEYLINIAGPVRLVLFADAGQVRDIGENFVWKESIFENQFAPPAGIILIDPFEPRGSHRPGRAGHSAGAGQGRRAAARSSRRSAPKIRFFMPVLNVPFRLIFAMNPSRGGVLDNSL